MKKIYHTPNFETVQLLTEGMIADSMKMGTTEGSTMLTQGKWNSADWSDDYQDEVEE